MIYDNYMLSMCKIYDIEYNNNKCHSRTFYTKSILIANGNVFLRVDYVLFQCLFSSNMELGFNDCPIFLIVKIVFLLSKIQIKLVEKQTKLDRNIF